MLMHNFSQPILTRSSATTEGLCNVNALCQLKSCQLLQSCKNKITFEKFCSRQMTLQVTQGHRNYLYSIGHISLPISSL